MENLDVMVLRTLRDWRQAGRRALLSTVVRTWGSSPRPIGSIMALAEDGAVVGSVSGGCIEDDLIARYSRAHGGDGAMPSGAPALVKYGITADEAHRFGLPCGGTLELLLEHDPDAEALDELVRALEQGRLVRRSVRLADGQVTFDRAAACVIGRPSVKSFCTRVPRGDATAPVGRDDRVGRVADERGEALGGGGTAPVSRTFC